MKMSEDVVKWRVSHFMDKTGALVEYDAERNRFLLNRNGKHYALEDYGDGDWVLYYGAVLDDRRAVVKWSDSVLVWQEALLFTEMMAIWEADEEKYRLFDVIAQADRHGLIDDVNVGRAGDRVHLFIEKRDRETTIVTYEDGMFIHGWSFSDTHGTIQMPLYAATAEGLVQQLLTFEKQLEAAL